MRRAREPFTKDKEYRREDALRAIGEHEIVGAFAVGRKNVALFAQLGDGPDDPHVPGRTLLRWPGKAPSRVAEREVSTFVFVGTAKDNFRFLGTARPIRYIGLPRSSPKRYTASHAGSRTISDVHFELETPLTRDRWLDLLGTRLMPNQPPFPEEDITKLANNATPDQCWIALESFVRRWYQMPVDLEKRPNRKHVGPPLLLRLLALVDSVPALFQQNHLVPAEDLAVEDRRVIFLVENQSVCCWATDAQGSDPRVWYRNNDGEPWLEELVPLSRFMIQAVLHEAILRAPFGGHATNIPVKTLQAIRTRLDPVGDNRWAWCGARYFARNGALAMVMESPGQCDLFLGARTPFALARFEDLVTDDWHTCTF